MRRKGIKGASLHELRMIYGASPFANAAIDYELNRRHAASIRKERRNLKANGLA